jgi:undecaprenyl-diphosphatase
MVHPGYRKRTVFLLVLVLVVRFWFGQTFELSGQEAYLWLQGHGTFLSPSYWERGPLVPLLIRIGTDFFGDTELGVRWLAAVICCGSGFVLFYLARHWYDARSAFFSVVLYLVLPLFAWKLSFMTEATVSIGLMALALLAFTRAIESDRLSWWLLGGAACGLGLLVAISNAWWVVGLLLYFAINPLRHARLREGRLWGTVVLALLFLAPIIKWWAGAQVSDIRRARILNAWPLSHGFSFNQGFHFIGLEILYLSPLFFVLLVAIIVRTAPQLMASPRSSLLLCLPLPGLIWLNFAAFFREGQFELVPALFLPLVLLAGCYLAQLSATRISARWVAWAVAAAALVQTLAGLNPFYFAPRTDGHGSEVRRVRAGDGLPNLYSSHHISWRTLAEGVRRLQQDEGATLLIADSPEAASALSFYLPRNPFVYVAQRPDHLTQFDFWDGYASSASPNDSALYLAHSTNAEHPANPPTPDIYHNFATVKPIDDPPLPDFDKSWDIWSCQNFVGTAGQNAADQQATPIKDTDALPR